MNLVIAAAESVILVSVVKPLIVLITFGLWAKFATHIDKDLEKYFLPRQAWNMVSLGTAILSLLLVLFIPIFWVGWPLAMIVIVGCFVAYHFFRNNHVPEDEHWTWADVLNVFYSVKPSDESSKKEKAPQAAILITDHQGARVPVPEEDHPFRPIYDAMVSVFEFSLPRRAERTELLADAKQTAVTVMIDGVKYAQAPLEAKIGLGVIDFLKEKAGLEVTDRRKKQQGKLTIVHGDAAKACVLTTSGTTRGLSLVVEVDPGQFTTLKFDALGMTESQKAALLPIINAEPCAGSVIVVAPPKNGMTTTLYALASTHDPYTKNVTTLETQTSVELEGVNHTIIRTGKDAPSPTQQLTAMVLRDPNVIMMDALTDPDLAKSVPTHAEEVRFYFGLRQTDTFTALRAWMQAIDNAEDAGRTLQAIISQRLVRRLCQTCRIPYRPDPGLLKKMNLPADRVSQLYKQSGKVRGKNDEPMTCPACLGLGYIGRVAIFEVMALDDDARSLLMQNQLDHLRSYLRKNRMLLLQEAAMTRVVEGVTSISEVTRVFSSGKS